MNEEDFEGSIILEQLAAKGLVDEFLEAVDADDAVQVLSLLREADVDEEEIEIVLKKMEDGKH